MSEEFKFKQDEIVEFDNNEISGKGRICGVVTIAHPVIGSTYILEPIECNVKFPNETYPFKMFAMFECMLEKVNKETE